MNRDESRRSKRSRVDRNFEMGPPHDILVSDFDDERTLDEEEALEGGEDTHNELSNLEKEGNMPLEDLLEMYNYKDRQNDDEDDEEEDEDEDEEEDDEDPASYEPDLKQFYTEMVKSEESVTVIEESSKTTPDIKNIEVSKMNTLNCIKNTLKKPEEPNKLPEGSPEAIVPVNSISNNIAENVSNSTSGGISGNNSGSGSGLSRLLRSVSRPQSEEEEDDCDYSPDEEEWKKTIMVGSDYQAPIPEGLCKYDDALPYENDDKMLWDPSPIQEQEIEEFLMKAKEPSKGPMLPNGSHLRDDEQALYLLLQCGYNLDEALRRRKMNVLPSTESVSLWSEDECQNFESGLRNYGKDFHTIQKIKVRTRSVGELVQFYYLWKKTERHDIFTYKARLEKKKYALHPGITDYMDRFLEEQEGVRDRSSSPSVHCLMHGDNKRQKTQTSSMNNKETKSAENWDGLSARADSSATNLVNTDALDPLAIDNESTICPSSLPSLPSGMLVIPILSHKNVDSSTSVPISKPSAIEKPLLSWSPTIPSNIIQSHTIHQSHSHLINSSPSSAATVNEDTKSPESLLPHLPS